jgi:glycosyltransferase involved in cell wall biosynthesis
MRALVTADTIGGVWTYARELVTGLSRRGVEVTLVSFGEIPNQTQSEWIEGLVNVDYRATAFKLEWMQDAEYDLKASSEFLLDLIAETRPDLLHFSQYCYGALRVNLPKVVVAHSDVCSWWAGVYGKQPEASSWIQSYREIVSCGLHGATSVVAPSRWMLGAINEHYGNVPHATVIHNGRNPGLFNPYVSKEDLVIGVGRVWDRAKQVSLLAECAHNVPVWIVGSEKHPDPAYQNNSSRQRVRGVRWCGQQSERQLRQLFSRASMYVATSQYEPFGLAPLEAALSRCAIIANDIPTFRELWGESALYFRTNDAEDLARKIDQLQNDRELRLTYANLAYRRAKQKMTAERMVNDYINLYQNLVPAGAAVA